jgi:hypothetical protein
MNTATVTARSYTSPDEPSEPGLCLRGAGWALRALIAELPSALDHDASAAYLRGTAPTEVHVWRALRGATAEEVEAGVRRAALLADLDFEVAS